MIRPWTRRHALAVTVLAAGLLIIAYLFGRPPMPEEQAELKAVQFSDIAGWRDEDHGAAFEPFRRSCEKIVAVAEARQKSGDAELHPLTGICRDALALSERPESSVARKFFEANFVPHRYDGEPIQGFVTGYYEPEVKGSRTKSEDYPVPVYRVPDDLEQLFPDAERARRNAEMTAGRRVNGEIVPYFDRREIEQGALEGRGLEILWLADEVDAFYMHIQGSGRVALDDGSTVRLSYAAKNGHAYTAIGGILIADNEITREEMSMQAVRDWLASNPEKARDLMRENRSYIFFRELQNNADALGPEGAQGVPLTPLRSLAVDTSIHAIGSPVWVDVPDLDLHGAPGFHSLMIAQDTGSAIRGPERGDIFFGSGDEAGALAGSTKHTAQFTIFHPRGAKPGS